MNGLSVRGSDGTERNYVFAEGASVTIGRHPNSGIHLPDTQVSWKHALLTCSAEGWLIEDLGSSNGTFVDGKRVQRHVLHSGEQVRIGPYDLAFAKRGIPSPTSASERTLFARVSEPQAAARRDDVVPKAVAPHRRKDRSKRIRFGGLRGLRVAIGRLLPISGMSARYRGSDLRHDALAGLTVAAMIVPQGMAYAMLAGLPPVMGLYASILPMIVYAFTGSGRQTSIGPVTLDSLMVVLGLSTLAVAGTGAYIVLAVLLTAMIGALQLGMGALRLGFLVNFLSYPVLAGFTAAAAVITILSQLKHLLGIGAGPYASFHRSILEVAEHLPRIQVTTLTIGAACLLALWAVKRWAPRFPAALGLVVIFTVVTYLFGLDSRGVDVLGPVPSGLPSLSFPAVEWADVRQLLPLALTMALVGFAQTISVGKSLGNKYGYDVAANRELAALGLSNLTSSLSQGYPVSASLARSALNASAGARTQVATVVAALCVGITTLYFTPLFYYLPNAALAAILVVSALGLIDTAEIRYLFKVKATEGALLVFTFAATLILGIMLGLLLGVIASILLFITLNTRPHTAVLGRLPGTNIFRNVEQFPEAQTIAGLVILRIDASLYFANAVFLKEKIHEICDSHGSDLEAIVLDASAVNDLDSSADTALHQLSKEFKDKKIEFYIAGIKAPVREVMKRSGLYDRLGGDHFFFTIDAAVRRFQQKAGQGAAAPALPEVGIGNRGGE